MKTKFTILVISALLLLPAGFLFAQGGKLQHSENALMGKRIDGQNVNILIGNVKLTQPKTVITCDSAVFYPKRNYFEGFGSVRIFDRVDSSVITSRKLFFEGDSRMALIRENVVYNSDSVYLYTEFLDYDMTNRSAKYFNGGKVIDNTNVLTSENGFYDTEARVVTFRGDVVLTNPDYVLEAEDLVYNLVTEIAVVNSPNTITNKDGTVLHAEQGSEFNTNVRTSEFFVSDIESESYILKADKIYFDDVNKFYKADGHVRLIGKENNTIVTGERARYWKNKGETVIFGHPVMKKFQEGDTLYMTADTLRSIDNEDPTLRRMLGYKTVKLYRLNLQGISDSLAYHMSDSIFHFYDDPVLWNEDSQITADTISVTIQEGTIDKMLTRRNSFIISEDSLQNFNQLKGRDMDAYFSENLLKKVNVDGNGESIYFALEEETGALMGMNNVICSKMTIRLKQNQVSNISYYTNPDGKFIPTHELKESQKQLKGFTWRIEERPELWQILDMSEEDFNLQYNKPSLLEENIYQEELPVESFPKEPIPDSEGLN